MHLDYGDAVVFSVALLVDELVGGNGLPHFFLRAYVFWYSWKTKPAIFTLPNVVGAEGTGWTAYIKWNPAGHGHCALCHEDSIDNMLVVFLCTSRAVYNKF